MIKSPRHYDGLAVTFNVTTECNLKCEYCYETQKHPGYLPLDYAHKFIDLILSDANPFCNEDSKFQFYKKGIILDFIGGDALAVPHLCDNILQYFMFQSALQKHHWANKWRSSISTNGTWFQVPEVRQFLLKYKKNISVGVSVDGCPEIHNLNRNNSMKQIFEGWDWYLWFCAQANIVPQTKATCNKNSIPYLSASIKFLHEVMHLKYIAINFIFDEMNLSYEDYRLLDEQMGATIDYILEHCDDLYVSMFDKNMTIGKSMEDADTGWCGAGSMPCLAIDGKIYSCFRFLPISVNPDVQDMNIGDIWNGFNKPENILKVQESTRGVISEKTCKDCIIESICAWCIAGAYAKTGELIRETNVCKINQLRDKWARTYWNKYNTLKNIPERFEFKDYSKCLK